MPVYKGNIILGVGEHGWSETYYFDKATHADAMTALDALCTLRMAMSKSDVLVQILRVSDVAVKGDSFLQPATTGAGTYVDAMATTFDTDVSLQVSGYSADHLAWTHWFIRGLPSSVVATDTNFELIDPVPAAFTAARVAYQAGLVAGPKLYTKKPNPPGTKNAVSIATTSFRGQLPIRKSGRPFRLPRGRRVTV